MPKAGDVIGGKYRLTEPIGGGDSWKGIHETLQSAVEIKFVAESGKEALGRFTREARTAAAIRHDNVVSIIDFGTTERGEPYMILEYLEGETLAHRIARHPPMSASEALKLGELALTGLAAVHDAGIVHRGLTPSTIFLVRDAEGSYPKIIDFGISKSVDKDSGQGLTIDGLLLGVPEYLSPEQARGERKIGPRADLYSMGVILFEMLVGYRPFEPGSARKILVRKMTEQAPLLEELRPELGTPISDVLARALTREPGKRWPDARAMRQALMDASDAIGGAIRSAPGPKRAAAPAPAQRKTGGRSWLGILAILVVAIGGGALGLELWRPGTLTSGRLPQLVPDTEESAPDPGAVGTIEAIDAGVVAPDAGPERRVAVRVHDVPPGSSIVLDGTRFGPAAVDQHRQRSTVELSLGRRASSFEIVVEAPGFAPWSARRWALRDVSFSPRFRPAEAPSP